MGIIETNLSYSVGPCYRFIYRVKISPKLDFKKGINLPMILYIFLTIFIEKINEIILGFDLSYFVKQLKYYRLPSHRNKNKWRLKQRRWLVNKYKLQVSKLQILEPLS